MVDSLRVKRERVEGWNSIRSVDQETQLSKPFKTGIETN